jgi:predicted outer membrane repeat protein
LWALPLAPALAGGVVGTGTPASCTEAALNSALAGGGTITFNCGAAPHTILSSAAKTITLDTTLDGGGTITLDGQDGDRLFVVRDSAVLTLRNVVLDHGFALGDGGAIHNGSVGADMPGAVILENSTIRNSLAGQSGGAIVSTGPLTITDSLLENNSALNGGALYPRFAGARTTIINSTLRYNTAADATNGWGGALLVWDGAAVTIEGGEIFSNTARVGGGIYAFSNTRLTIDGGGLRSNTATHSGGGLLNAGSAVLTGVAIDGNSADSGGGLYNSQAITLTAVTLTANTVISNGAGLYNEGTATLTGGALSGNSAAHHGGGLFNGGAMALMDAIVSSNSAQNGGGLYNDGSNAFISGVTFSHNSAGGSGGGMFSNTGTILTGTTFISNTAVGNGGGLFNFYSATLNNVAFTGNAALNHGGGINNVGVVELTNVTLADNSANGNGGGLNHIGGLANLTNVTLSGNSASNAGGGILSIGLLNLTRVTLSGNAAASYGGGLYNNSTAMLRNVTLSGNTSRYRGGGLFNFGTATLTHVTLSGNSAASGGGGIYNLTEGYTVTLKNSLIAYSPAGGNCGGQALTTNNSDKYSLSSDNTCALGGPGSQNNVDPLLTGLGSYGGPTQVHMLKSGSLAIDGVAGSDALTSDQRNLPRPQGNGYDIGAVERQPTDSDLTPRLYLPLLIH